MLTVDSAISRFRRDMAVGAVLRAVLWGGASLALALNLVPGNKVFDGGVLFMALLAIWMVLSYRSVRGSRLAAVSPSLIAAGQFAEAEQQIEAALHSFSLFRSAKMLSLHHLALLWHAQRRWRESAILCRTLLGQRLGSLQSLAKPSRLILADALLEMGDVRGAYAALVDLYTQRLTLGEALNLLLVQLDYESRIGAWGAMIAPASLPSRLQLAELMPARQSMRAQALMALAARKTGQVALAEWLRARAELLLDVAELTKDRPVLWELWQTA